MDTDHAFQKPHGLEGFLPELSADDSPILGAMNEKSLSMLQASAHVESGVLWFPLEHLGEKHTSGFFPTLIRAPFRPQNNDHCTVSGGRRGFT